LLEGARIKILGSPVRSNRSKARAVAAGEIRSDISPEDVLRALAGMCYMHDQPGWQKSAVRLFDVFVDGLRVRTNAGGKTTRLSPRDEASESKDRPPRRGSRRSRK
jgi:hypothetical protein